jgi:hypothetical protein
MNRSATIAASATMTRMETYSQTGTDEVVEGHGGYAQDDWAWTVPAFGKRPATSTTTSMATPSVSGTMREPLRLVTECRRTHVLLQSR